jgi:hypothetical protein
LDWRRRSVAFILHTCLRYDLDCLVFRQLWDYN